MSLKSKVRLPADEIVFKALSVILLVLLCALIVLPFLNVLALAFNDGKDAMRGGITFFPRVWSLDNFRYVLSNSKYLGAYKITIARTLIGSTLSVIITAMAAYALRDRSLPGRGFFNRYFILTMFFSGGTIPMYLALQSYGLLNSFWVYIFNASIISVWDMMVMRTFFDGISESFEEAARLDGANDLRIFVQIILPLSKAVLAVIFLFKAVYHWNDWFSGAYYVKNTSLYPMQTIVQRMLQLEEALKDLNAEGADSIMNRHITGESLKMAIVVVTIGPIICIYPFVQKYFVKGVMIGSVKG